MTDYDFTMMVIAFTICAGIGLPYTVLGVLAVSDWLREWLSRG